MSESERRAHLAEVGHNLFLSELAAGVAAFVSRIAERTVLRLVEGQLDVA